MIYTKSPFGSEIIRWMVEFSHPIQRMGTYPLSKVQTPKIKICRKHPLDEEFSNSRMILFFGCFGCMKSAVSSTGA
jgi:hypothetical protein